MSMDRYLLKSRFSKRVFLGILLILALFAASFVLFQQSREKQFRIELLNTQLQDYNNQLHESLASRGSLSQEWLDAYVASHPKGRLRLTIVSANGVVIYDNLYRNVSKLASHIDRKEIAAALSQGRGYDINRMSKTLGEDYFYSATYFPQSHYVIRTALPYDLHLVDQLKANHLYLWFALALVVILIAMVWRFCNHLDRHIIYLRTFAGRAENDEPLSTPDLMSFTDDELGEVAERIIVLYRRLKETRQEQDKLKRELTQNIAHELKTPVASIQGYLDTILSDSNMDEQTKRSFLEQSFAQASRLTSLIRDILILNRLDESGGRSFEMQEVVDILQTISQVVADTKHAAEKQQMQFNISATSDNAYIVGTEKMVYSVFRNLADNAIAYSGRGTTISIRITGDDSLWHILFADNGVGVPAKHLPRLFERFYRVDKGRSREAGGTGLGLAIVKNSVLVMHGQISVQNGCERGLEFHISFPKEKH